MMMTTAHPHKSPTTGARENVIDKAIQIFGAAGVTEDHPLSAFYRQARMARLYDGPDEVHKMVVARRILKAYERPPSR